MFQELADVKLNLPFPVCVMAADKCPCEKMKVGRVRGKKESTKRRSGKRKLFYEKKNAQLRSRDFYPVKKKLLPDGSSARARV